MNSAVIVGVITGGVGLLGIAATFFSPQWTQRKLEQRQNQRAFRAARRLVVHELDLILVQLDGLRARDEVGPGMTADPTILPDHEWLAHKSLLATLLEEEAWTATSNTYKSLIGTKFSLQSGRQLTATDRLMLDQDKARCRQARDLLAGAGD